MKKIYWIIFWGITLITQGCFYDPPEKRITVYNETDSTIYLYWSCIDSITNDHPLTLFEVHKSIEYPYIINGRTKDCLIVSPSYRINPYSCGGIGTTGHEDLLNQCPDKQLYIFYISEETMRTRTWNEIVSGQIFIRKEIYTIENLEPYNWTIEYK